MTLITRLPKTKVEIQIDDLPAFIPDKFILGGIGKEWATLHYYHAGREHVGIFQQGRWESGAEDVPRFHVENKLYEKTAPI